MLHLDQHIRNPTHPIECCTYIRNPICTPLHTGHVSPCEVIRTQATYLYYRLSSDLHFQRRQAKVPSNLQLCLGVSAINSSTRSVTVTPETEWYPFMLYRSHLSMTTLQQCFDPTCKHEASQHKLLYHTSERSISRTKLTCDVPRAHKRMGCDTAHSTHSFVCPGCTMHNA